VHQTCSALIQDWQVSELVELTLRCCSFLEEEMMQANALQKWFMLQAT
jgi:hypothetical protein